MNVIDLSKAQALKKRIARANGHSGIICIPAECIGRTYERYMDTATGIITLVPTEHTRTAPETEDVQ